MLFILFLAGRHKKCYYKALFHRQLLFLLNKSLQQNLLLGNGLSTMMWCIIMQPMHWNWSNHSRGYFNSCSDKCKQYVTNSCATLIPIPQHTDVWLKLHSDWIHMLGYWIVCTHHFHQNNILMYNTISQSVVVFNPVTFYDRDVLSVRIESNQCAV